MADEQMSVNTSNEPHRESRASIEQSSETDITVSSRRAALRARWAEMVFITALAAYAVMAVLAHRYAYFEWDLTIARGIQSITVPGFYELMVGVSWLGNGAVPFILVVGAGLALVLARFKIEGVVCLIGVGVGDALNHLLKFLSARPRPDGALVQVLTHARFESFPSGHVTFFVEYFGFLFFLAYVLLRPCYLRRAALLILGLLIALVGVSRVRLGAHWPSDVVGAYLAGGAWLLLMIEIYRRWKARQNER
ncbi:MAG TPA: phosphatase PAP2 family protein [Blastocatellia bacterium]|jgi:undecaprenyl-diphosphatase|nr:phosphatase PAP2 family protein [Blastocatellia bacterium]